MDAITPKEVRKISALARLALTDDEVSQATRDLSGILEHFSAIGSIDTANVSPTDDASGLSNISREDIAHPNTLCSSQDILDRVPNVRQDYAEVPGVFKESSVS